MIRRFTVRPLSQRRQLSVECNQKKKKQNLNQKTTSSSPKNCTSKKSKKDKIYTINSFDNDSNGKKTKTKKNKVHPRQVFQKKNFFCSIFCRFSFQDDRSNVDELKK